MSFIRFGSEREFIPGTSDSYVYPTDEGIDWYGDSMDDLVEICCRQLEKELAVAVAQKYLEIRDMSKDDAKKRHDIARNKKSKKWTQAERDEFAELLKKPKE